MRYISDVNVKYKSSAETVNEETLELTEKQRDHFSVVEYVKFLIEELENNDKTVGRKQITGINIDLYSRSRKIERKKIMSDEWKQKGWRNLFNDKLKPVDWEITGSEPLTIKPEFIVDDFIELEGEVVVDVDGVWFYSDDDGPPAFLSTIFEKWEKKKVKIQIFVEEINNED